jgi:hypothetical protein
MSDPFTSMLHHSYLQLEIMLNYEKSSECDLTTWSQYLNIPSINSDHMQDMFPNT